VGLARVREHPEIFEKSDGAIIFQGEKYGLHTRVFINKEGLPTYETKDIGLMEVKQQWWPFDLSLTVTASEQEQYFAVMTKAAELVNPTLAGKVELVVNGMLMLPTGKMSSRTGNIVPVLSLVSEVQHKVLERMEGSDLEDKEIVARNIAVSAIKYAILRSSAGKDIVFDIEQSISLEGASGPYLQYTYARICSILEKAKKEGVIVSQKIIPEKAYDIERTLYQFPEVTKRAVFEREPHYVTTYLTELAGAFNTWYGKEKIVDAIDQYSPYKIAVARAVAYTLKNGLWLLGIKAPERM
jgi:arginyl-tRNA synthetase